MSAAKGNPESGCVANNDTLKLNIRAEMALKGASLTHIEDIVALLNADVPIERRVRLRMAELLRGDSVDGMQLKLTGIKSARDKAKAGGARHEWFDIGQWIQQKIDEDRARCSAIEDAVKQFNISDKKADSSLDYYRAANAWIVNALKTEAGQGVGDEYLKHLYIFWDYDESLAVQLNESLFSQLPPISSKLEEVDTSERRI